MKNFLGINWKSRANNPMWWGKIALAVLGIPIASAGLKISEVTDWGTFFSAVGQAYANPYMVLIIVIALYNSITEDTSKGFGDLSATKKMIKPFTDKDPNNVFGLISQHNEDDEVVDGIDGKEISDGDMKDEIEQEEGTNEESFGDIDNLVFGDKSTPQDVGNDSEEEMKEKTADADIKGSEIKG